jgi:hypothetical protein
MNTQLPASVKGAERNITGDVFEAETHYLRDWDIMLRKVNCARCIRFILLSLQWLSMTNGVRGVANMGLDGDDCYTCWSRQM